MATTKVSALPSKTTLTGGEEILITDGSTSKKSTITAVRATATDATKLPLAGGTMTGNIVMSGSETVDGVDISARDAVLTSTTTTANAALPKTGGAMTGAITTNSTFDGRDVATDGTKLDGIEANATADQTDAEIRAAVEAATDSNVFTDADHSKLNAIEASADVTDATNVAAAGALMDSEVTNLAQVKAFDSSDYATAAQGTTADAALPKAGGTMTGNLTVSRSSGNAVTRLQGASNSQSSKLFISHTSSGSGGLFYNNNEFDIFSYGDIRFNSGTGNTGDTIANERMVIKNSGKVGIGSVSPSATLEINGNAVAKTDTDTSNTGSVTLDFAANQNFVLTLTGNVTLANPSTEVVGQSGFITFIQDGTGGRTVALGTDYETAGGAGLTLTSTASATDIVPYVVVASGRILLGTPQLAFA